MMASVSPPLVMHVIYRLAMGGLENGLVNLINHMPPERYRHAIVCLTDFTDFRERIWSPSVSVLALQKKPGVDLSAYRKLWGIIQDLQPMIVHTRNLPTFEMAALAAVARVPVRIHGEHGRDVHDAYGTSKKFLVFRKVLDPAVHHYVTVSQDLEQWLIQKVAVSSEKVSQIYNGVDKKKFCSPVQKSRDIFPRGFVSEDQIVVGTVGRFQKVKDQATLVNGLAVLLKMHPTMANAVRLVMVGDGPLRGELEQLVYDCQLTNVVWMSGPRTDISSLLQSMDIFVLPSEAEGISNTILEAMASGLPVIATRVGGNVELVREGETGLLIPPKDPQALSKALLTYLEDTSLLRRHGERGRKRVEMEFSMEAMVEHYLQVYDHALGISPSPANQLKNESQQETVVH